jgi:hypothetical protein
MVSKLISGPLCMVAVFFATSVASAAEVSSDPKEAFQRGVSLFKAEEYALAHEHLKAAYELSGRRSSTILALAQCERMMKRWDDALTHYEEYLASGVSPEEVARVNETIGVIKALKAREAKAAATAKPEPPPPPPAGVALVVEQPPEDEGSVLSSPWLWIATGVAVVGGGVALAVALSGGTEEPYAGNTGVLLRP